MPDVPSPILKRARSLRQHMTRSEEIFWQRVRNRQIGGLKLRRQVPIHGFVVDFACLSNRLVIEIDGGIHSLETVQARDQVRDAKLTSIGFQVMRFSDRAIFEELETVVGLIEDYVRNPYPLTPAPSTYRSTPKGARGDHVSTKLTSDFAHP